MGADRKLNRVYFRLALHPTPVTNARGETVHSVALEEHEQFSDLSAPAAPKLSRQTRDALAVLDKLKARHDRYGRSAPTLAQFRKALKDAKWGPTSEASWRKAWERLIAKVDFDINDALVCAPSVTP